MLRGRPHSRAASFSDTEAFLMKNAKAKQCLRASPTNGNLLLEDCNPESDFQDWSWQGDSLVNHGTGSCLSVVGTSSVQTSLCGSAVLTHWDCLNSLLFPLGSSQGYLVASRKGVTLDTVRGLKAQWKDVADRSVCEEKAGQCRTPGDTRTQSWGTWKGTTSVLGSFQPGVPHHDGSQRCSPLLGAGDKAVSSQPRSLCWQRRAGQPHEPRGWPFPA